MILQLNNPAAVLPGSIRVVAGLAYVTDNGSGVLTGPGRSGTINYQNGSISVTFNQAPANGVQILVEETMQGAITQMMQNSDNARTDMFMHHYGISTLAKFANSIGMSETLIRGYIDCPGQPNILTVQDAAHIYEGLATGTLLSAANVQILFSMMAGKNYDFSGIWASFQKQIGGVLGLGCAPVVTLPEGGNNLARLRVSLFELLPENFGPVGLQLLVHECLSRRRITSSGNSSRTGGSP